MRTSDTFTQPTRAKSDVKILDLPDKLLLNIGMSVALNSHVEFITELAHTQYVANRTPNLLRFWREPSERFEHWAAVLLQERRDLVRRRLQAEPQQRRRHNAAGVCVQDDFHQVEHE